MQYFQSSNGYKIVAQLAEAIKENKQYLSDIDGLIGDGDHGINMDKGFAAASSKVLIEKPDFSTAFKILADELFDNIGGSMGPLYGMLFQGMSEAVNTKPYIFKNDFLYCIQSGLDKLSEISVAKAGDKTILDTLLPACEAYSMAVKDSCNFDKALSVMSEAALKGAVSTKMMKAVFGRSSRLGERSIGVQDAGATSCAILLEKMSNGIRQELKESS